MSGLMRGIAAVATATVAFTFGGGVAFAGTAANIRVTDIRDVSAVVSWTGTAAEAGTVQYAAAVNGTCATSAYGSSAIDARGSGTSSSVHYVRLENLAPSTLYCYRPVSGGTIGTAGSFTTGPTVGLGTSDSIYGPLSFNGAPASDVIIYITLTEAGLTSAPFSTIVKPTDGGYYILQLQSARSSNNQTAFAYTNAATITLSIEGGTQGAGSQSVSLATARSVPFGLSVNVATPTPTATPTATPSPTATTTTPTATATTTTPTATSTPTGTPTPTPIPIATAVLLQFSPANAAVAPAGSVSVSLEAVVPSALSIDSWSITITYDNNVLSFSGCDFVAPTVACDLSASGQGSVAIAGMGSAAITNRVILLATLRFSAIGTEGNSSLLIVADQSELGSTSSGFQTVPWVQAGTSSISISTAPVIESVSPSIVWGGGGKSITVSGSNFVSGATVKVGSRFASAVNVLNSTTITAIAPPVSVFGDVTGDGLVKLVDAICVLRKASNLTAVANCPTDKLTLSAAITVTNPGGQGATKENAFTYQMADVTNDGAVKLVDAICVLRRASNLAAVANCPTPVAYIAPASMR